MATDNREEFAESVKKYLFYRQMYESACDGYSSFRKRTDWFLLVSLTLTVGVMSIILERLSAGAWFPALLLIISTCMFVYVFRQGQVYQSRRVEGSIRLLISAMRMTSFRNDIVWSASNERYLFSDASVYACRTTQPSAPIGDKKKENAVFEAVCRDDGGGYFLYMNSRYVEQWIRDAYYELDRLDDVQAAIYEAAEQGHPYAQYRRGTLEKDAAAAAQWVRRAADAGLAEAQYDLGSRAEAGAGVPQNLVFAYVWLHRAILNGADSGAKWNLDMVVEKMTPEQIAEAKKLLRGPLSFLGKHVWFVKDKIGETIAKAKPFLTPLVKKPAEWMMKWMESNYWPLIFIVPILLWIILTH